MALVIRGSLTRPAGSDSYPPKVGTVVPYARCQPIVDLNAQRLKCGWTFLGIEGNVAHLQKHGGHTPWRGGSKLGIVWSMDTDPGDKFEPWYVKTAASSYETRWIKFINFRNHQYDNAGNFLGYSADGHLHIEVADGWENYSEATLFDDYVEEMGIVAITDADVTKFWNYLLDRPEVFDDNVGHKAYELIVAGINTSKFMPELRDMLTALANAVAAIPAGNTPVIDYERLAHAMVDEFISRNLPPVV